MRDIGQRENAPGALCPHHGQRQREAGNSAQAVRKLRSPRRFISGGRRVIGRYKVDDAFLKSLQSFSQFSRLRIGGAHERVSGRLEFCQRKKMQVMRTSFDGYGRPLIWHRATNQGLASSQMHDVQTKMVFAAECDHQSNRGKLASSGRDANRWSTWSSPLLPVVPCLVHRAGQFCVHKQRKRFERHRQGGAQFPSVTMLKPPIRGE